ncbi:hypothetical protein [Streptomyces sp. 150FB]|uniref:hypothetical protein n=1 Tax=Streptomyces sp. 150FB TaxID=1576605 RepID=UPI000698948D|nr:hypothetical protein [Streptomyces sp. 150FB]
MTPDPNRPDDADTEGRTVPPYEGRKKSGGAAGKGESAKGGARTAGATSPVEDEDMRAAESMEAEGGATSTPADEKPAGRTRRSRDDDSGTGPAHRRGTPRGEDQP